MNKELIRFRINGADLEIAVAASRLLLDALREDLELTGTKRGCDDSSCGCCAVMVDGVPVLACATLAVSCDNAEITTIEGLGAAAALDPVQEGFVECAGAQCGFCTPGFMITTVALLKQNPNPSLDEIREALSSNLCRCTGYMQIYESVRYAIEKHQAATNGQAAQVTSGAKVQS
ncbi:MAG TPA: (2Fe-2S)-binding protein [Candidatus Limnocylindrales bacterium]|nr:(2Fe-2S)-binding protein [Candidatus Limnocylindrales bacterium]